MSTFYPWQRRRLFHQIKSLVFLYLVLLEWGTDNITLLDDVVYHTQESDGVCMYWGFSPESGGGFKLTSGSEITICKKPSRGKKLKFYHYSSYIGRISVGTPDWLTVSVASFPAELKRLTATEDLQIQAETLFFIRTETNKL